MKATWENAKAGDTIGRKQTHTPGPWHVQPIGSERYVEAAGPKMICDMQRNEAPTNIDIAEIDANARLIAAAPELLEALRYYVNLHAEHIHDMPERNENEGKQWRRTLDIARAAIAKAESQ